MRDKLRISVFVITTLLLAVSVLYNLTTGRALVSWMEVVLVAVIMFIAIGDRFTKMEISAKGVSIEQSVEKMVETAEKDVQGIEEFVEEDNPTTKITDIVGDTFEHPRDVWSKLILIRMALRRLLRKIANTRGMDYPPTASISEMTGTFRRQGIIEDFLAEQIEKIRDATFTAEWGTGQPPKPENMKFTLENYEKVFDALKERARSTSTRKT